MRKLGIIVAVATSAGNATGQISYGGYTFAADAFADRAEANEPGPTFINGAATIGEALTGFTPDTGLFNIGSISGPEPSANDFTLNFDDLAASDAAVPAPASAVLLTLGIGALSRRCRG